MAKPEQIFSLNLGSQSIRLAEFRGRPNGGIDLHDFRAREIQSDPAGEEFRPAQISAALREMMAEMQISGGRVNYAVSSQSVFARFVKLPAVEEEKIERIIAFEAQQNVPFPIDEVVWDYQLVGGGGNEQIQVVLVAIKADLLEEMNGAVEETGLRAAIVDVATMTLYNAFRFNYAELNGCSLLVDIGARTTNLLFVEEQKIFSRSIPIGGSSITAAVAKDFGEPFAAAETRKKRDGFVSLGGAYAEPPDANVARISKLMRSGMTRLHAEVMRSIGHYRTQQQGNAPERVFLCGGAASAPYMREFFCEKLQLPVEYFNALRNVGLSSSALVGEATRSAHLLGELVGLALRSVGTCPMNLNLGPPSVIRRQDLEKRRPFFMGAAAALIIAIVAWGLYYSRAAQVSRNAAERIQQKINTPMRVAEAKIDTLRKQAAGLDAVGVPLTQAINDRFFWVELLEELNNRLPKQDIWITELVPTSGGKAVGFDEKQGFENSAASTASSARARSRDRAVIDGVVLHGLYLFNPRQQEVVVDYFKNLVGSRLFNVDPNNQPRVIRSTIPNNTDWAFPYELRLELRNPLKLP
jgi:type IV pilus assembly protein PilM